MSEHYNGLTVTLSDDLSEERTNEIIKAITQIRGVISATAHVADVGTHLAYERARRELADRMWDILFPKRS